ncbi:MAG: exodeoxyribonuclease VII small subunit [Alphaproteobacteria bacterium]
MSEKDGSAKTHSAGGVDGVDAMSFEAALRELEGIVNQLETGDIALEDSIAKYERGEALKTRCETLLKTAEARVEKLTLDADGKPTGTQEMASQTP